MEDQKNKKDASPATQVIKEAIKEASVTDEKGRVIKLRKPGILAQYRLIDMLGGESAANATYVSMVVPLMFITAIDDDDAIVMDTRRQLDALISRLGEEGIQAVMTKVAEVWPPVDPQEEREAIKK